MSFSFFLFSIPFIFVWGMRLGILSAYSCERASQRPLGTPQCVCDEAAHIVYSHAANAWNNGGAAVSGGATSPEVGVLGYAHRWLAGWAWPLYGTRKPLTVVSGSCTCTKALGS